MNEELKKLIIEVREKLSNEPSNIVIGKLNEGLDLKDNSTIELGEYKEILKEINGGRFGSIDLWSYSDLKKNQFRVSDLEGQQDKWFEIGQILYEPLLLDKESGGVYLFDTIEEKLYDLDDDICLFLKNKVFGSDYAKVIPDYENDVWYDFLRRISLV